MTAQMAANNSAKIIGKEILNSPTLKIIKHAVTTLAPKSFQMTLLKMKINMQTLIGNVFGLQFKGLEASKEKLVKVKKSYAKEKGYIKFY